MPVDDEQVATIYSVAQHAGVSTATVSRALRDPSKVSEATYRTVMQSVDELHYIPSGSASSLAKKQQGAIGLVLPHITGWYYSELLVGFEMAASARDLAVILTVAPRGKDAALAVRSLAERTDGIAFLARSAVTDEQVTSLAYRRPVVIGARADIPGISVARIESYETARELTTHLLDLGRRNLVFVGDPEPGSDIEHRFRGFAAAHADHGLDPIPPIRSAMEEVDGVQVARQLLADGLPTDGLVCANDLIALAAAHELKSAGTGIGTDVAVVGWDNIMATQYTSPGLTTVAQPVFDLGAWAATELDRLIREGCPQESPTFMPTHIVHRESCGCSQNHPSDHPTGLITDPPQGARS